MSAAVSTREQCERNLLAALGRHGSAVRMRTRGEVNDPFVDKKKEEFKQVMERLVEAARAEALEHICGILEEEEEHDFGSPIDSSGVPEFLRERLGAV